MKLVDVNCYVKCRPVGWYQSHCFTNQQTFTLMTEDVCLGNLNEKNQTFQPKTNVLSDISARKNNC
jgi:hypothetical protein